MKLNILLIPMNKIAHIKTQRILKKKDYLQLTATKKSKPYLLSQPLQEFL